MRLKVFNLSSQEILLELGIGGISQAEPSYSNNAAQIALGAIDYAIFSILHHSTKYLKPISLAKGKD
jgi:hypothetical protein